MSLDGRDEALDDLVNERPGLFKGFSKKTKLFAIILIIGIIIGAILTHYYIEPIISQEKTNPADICFQSKELLTKENDCLYTLLDNAREDVKQCSTAYNPN